jgi:hypothetical protein
MSIISPEGKRLRCRLIHKFEQLASHLEAADESALTEAQDCLIGISMRSEVYTMGLVFRALVQTLDNMQGEIEAGGFRFVPLD